MNLNWNWGKGITLAIIAFISYILFMVFTMIATSSDLVEDNYYQEGVNFERKIQAIRNSLPIKEKMEIKITGDFLTLVFPKEVIMANVLEGSIHLYRPENGSKDKHFPFIKTNNNIINIPLEKIDKGNYKLLLSWKTEESDYYIDKGLIKI